MTPRDRKKIAQLQRRLKATKARRKSLNERANTVSIGIIEARSRSDMIFQRLHGKDREESRKRRYSLTIRHRDTERKVKKLTALETQLINQLGDLEEKQATLEDNIRRVRAGKKLGDEAPNPHSSLTDQEENVLKAIRHVGGRDPLVYIPDVIASLSYPKETTKRLLRSLAEKNVVVFHRHDYPAGLTPKEKARMIRSKQGGYFHAVAIVNPGRHHLPGATAKQQRQYEHVLSSELARGFSLTDAKSIGAATVRKRAKNSEEKKKASKNPRYLITATRRRIEKDVDLGVLQDDTAKKALSRAKGIYKGRGYTAMKAQKRNPSPAQIRARKAFAKMAKDRARLARSKKRNSSATKTLKKAGRAAKVAVRSTLDAGSKLLKAGAKALNPVKLKKFPTSALQSLRSELQQTLSKTKGATARHVASRLKAVEKELSRRNPTRRGMRKLYGAAKRVDPGGRKKTLRKVARTAKRMGARAVPGWERNPSPKSIRKKFAGRVGAGRDLYFPQGTPQGLAKLGRLKLIKTKRGTIKPSRKNPSGEVWLCADTRGKLHLGSTQQAPLYNGPAQSLGEVVKIEYEESKPHLGYGPTIWFHRMGEETGKRPTLYSDGKGGLKFKGGAYKIKREGIVN